MQRAEVEIGERLVHRCASGRGSASPKEDTLKLGETLKQYVPAKGDQKAKAYEWIEKAAPHKSDPPEPTTVVSHLSRCLNDNVVGVRFFFSEETSAKALLDVLGVPDAARPALLELADEILATGQARPPKLVIDLTAWPCTGDAATALFDGVKASFLVGGTPLPILPILLIVTEGQYDRLPRSFDDYGDDLRTERAPVEGEVQLSERAGRSALVVSRRRFSPIERWVAVEWRGGVFETYPIDAVKTFAVNGHLDRPLVVERALAPPSAAPTKMQPLPTDPIQLRKLAFALADPEQAERLGPAATRHAWAAELGVVATSTARERLELEIAAAQEALGQPVATVASDELQRLLRKAERQPVASIALRVGDELHAINPPEDTERRVSKHPRVHIARFSPPTPMLSQILDDLREAPWSHDDMVEDPYLDHYLARWEKRGPDASVARHAIATLALANRFKATRVPEAVTDWRAALAAILNGDPPAASVLLATSEKLDQSNRMNSRSGDFEWFMAPHQRVVDTDRSASFRARAPLVSIACHDTIVAVTRKASGDWSGRTLQSNDVVLNPASASDLELWLNLVDSSPACGGSPDAAPKVAGSVSWLKWEAGATLDIDWGAFDRRLAIHWLALRRAVRHGDAVKLADGTIVVHMASALVAEIAIRHHTSRLAREHRIGAFRRTATENDARYDRAKLLLEDEPRMVERTGGGGTSGYQVPPGIYLAAAGFAADIRFIAAPILGALDVGSTAVSFANEESASTDDDDDD
jgi:hypothetical protein